MPSSYFSLHLSALSRYHVKLGLAFVLQFLLTEAVLVYILHNILQLSSFFHEIYLKKYTSYFYSNEKIKINKIKFLNYLLLVNWRGLNSGFTATTLSWIAESVVQTMMANEPPCLLESFDFCSRFHKIKIKKLHCMVLFFVVADVVHCFCICTFVVVYLCWDGACSSSPQSNCFSMPRACLGQIAGSTYWLITAFKLIFVKK